MKATSDGTGMVRSKKVQIVVGCFLLAFSVFAALSVISWHRSDPGSGEYANSAEVGNWCGTVGAYFSGFLMQNVGGPATFFGVALLAFWVYLLLTARQRLLDAYLKIIGSIALILSISALTAHAGMGKYFTSVVGSALSNISAEYFGDIGAFLLLLLITTLSLLLATDFMVVAPIGKAGVALVSIARAAVAKLLVTRPWHRKAEPAPGVPAHRPDLAERAMPVPVKRPAIAQPAKPDAARLAANALVAVASRESTAPACEVAVSPEPKANAAECRPEKPAGTVSEPNPSVPRTLPVQSKPPAAPRPRPVHDPRKDSDYIFPQFSLLDAEQSADSSSEDQFIQEKAKVLEDTLAEFGVAVKVVGIETGPVITQYELELAPGIKVTRVVSLSDDIAMALKAPSVRIVAPIPGRDSVGVEVPNTKTAVVRLKGLFDEHPADKAGIIPVYLGRDAQGQALVSDLTELPHLLIAGATGAGKSVCINSVILSVLMSRRPDDVKLLLVDPKMVELSVYKDIPHLICPVVTDMKRAATVLEWACVQMDSRYDCLAAANVRHISRYNKLGPRGIRERLGVPADAQIEIPDKLPYIIIIIDELADLMMVAAKEIETFITRLAQKSRAVGIHLVLATQRPSVDVITGLIKSNLPARLSFKVSSKIDSRTILDQNGAEKLLGRGDMLFLPPATAKLVRAQGTFVADEEIRRVVDFVKDQQKPEYDEELVSWKKAETSDAPSFPGDDSPGVDDPLYDQCVQIVIENQRGSVSLLQRRLEIGYGRAARLIDLMAERGILGPYKGSQAREVMFTLEQWEEMRKELKGRSR